MSHTMGEYISSPQNALEQLLASIGKNASSGRENLNKIIRHEKSGYGLGNLIFGEGPEMLDEMSWGKSPILPSGHGFRIDPRMGDVAGIAGLLGNAPKNLIKGMYKGALKGNLSGAPKSILQAQKGYIVKPGSPLFNGPRAARAQSLQLAGASVDEIFKRTKTWLDSADGVPRQEIAHGDEKYLTNKQLKEEFHALNERIFEASLEGRPSLKDMGRLSEISALDADIGDLSTRLINSPLEKHNRKWFKSIQFNEPTFLDNGLAGSWNSGSKINPKRRPPRMMIDNAPADLSNISTMDLEQRELVQRLVDEEIQKTVRHEGNHALQGTTGLHGGGTDRTVSNYLASEFAENVDLWQRLDDAAGPLNLKQKRSRNTAIHNLDVVKRFTNDEKHRLYLALSDESQARLVEGRWEKSQKQMNADPFFKKYPVPPEDMIWMPDALKPGEFKINDFLKQVNKHLDSPDLMTTWKNYAK